MDARLVNAIDTIADDATSSASAIVPRVLEILRTAHAAGALEEAARALCRAQPSMASVWNAAAAALADPVRLDALGRFAQQVARAPAALGRCAVDALVAGTTPGRPLHVVTCSASVAVRTCLEAVARERRVVVTCAEGRPLYEGRGQAVALAAAGLEVGLSTDAGAGVALAGATALLVGADAISEEWLINKVGTRLLAAAAAAQGIPVYVASGRDKAVPREWMPLLGARDGPPEEVWPDASPGIRVRNPYFERIPLAFVSALITDIGVIAGEFVPEACQGWSRQVDPTRLVKLLI